MCCYSITVNTIIDGGSKSCYTGHYKTIDFGHRLTYFYGCNFMCEKGTYTKLLLELQNVTEGNIYLWTIVFPVNIKPFWAC